MNKKDKKSTGKGVFEHFIYNLFKKSYKTQNVKG